MQQTVRIDFLDKIIICIIAGLFFMMVQPALAEEDCRSISQKPVKLEAWISKCYEKYLKSIRKDLGRMGNTRVGLFVYQQKTHQELLPLAVAFPPTLPSKSSPKQGNIILAPRIS